MRPTVDVLIPYYGPLGYLQEAVASVRQQDCSDWRLVILDDACPVPGAREWLAAQADERTTVVRNEYNLGANLTYARALQLAEHEYIVVMGADDVMRPTFLSRLLSNLRMHPGVDVVQPGVEVIDGSGHPVLPTADRVKRALRPPGGTVLRGETLAHSLLRGNWTYFPSLAWRRTSVRCLGFRRGLDVVQDLALLLDVALAGGSMLVDDDVTFAYRRHSSSDSSVRATAGGRFTEERAFFRDAQLRCRAEGWTSAERAARWHLTSRLNAASLVPSAVRRREAAAVGRLVRHVVA